MVLPMSTSSSSSSTECFPDDDVLHIGRKFKSFEEVKELMDKFKACGHPMHVFSSQSVEEYNVIAYVYFGQCHKRSNGIRYNQRHLALGCTAKLTISYDRKFQCLVLRNCTLQHNHEISSAVIKRYASNHKLSMQEQVKVNQVLELTNNQKITST